MVKGDKSGAVLFLFILLTRLLTGTGLKGLLYASNSNTHMGF